MNKQFLISITVSVITLTGVAFGAEVSDWGPETNHVQMNIKLELAKWPRSRYLSTEFMPGKIVTTVNAGDDCSLIVKFRNNSTNETFFGWCSGKIEVNPQTGFGLKIISANGGDISPLAKEYPPNFAFLRSGVDITCWTNKIESIHWPLGTVYKLDKVGTYKITATKIIETMGKPSQRFVVTSNPLLIKVIPKGGVTH